MASKSQTFEIVLTANGSAVTEVMEELQNLAKGYAAELDKLTEKKEQGIKLTEEEEKRAESLTKKIQGLNTAWERNAIELRKVDEIMKDLTQATGNEMGRALKTLSARFKRAKSDAVDDLIKIKEQMQDVRHEMSKREGIDALKKAKATLTDLANTPLDKLKMGLESIEKKLATMSEAEKQAADGLTLLEGKSRYQAQIAVTEYGRAGGAPIGGMNNEQLRAEQQRLRQGYMATEGVKGYEAISQEYLTRLQRVNQEIKNMTEAERKQAQAAKELERAEQQRLEFARHGQQTHKTLANLEKASYEDMEIALQHLQAQYSKYASGDTKHIQRNLQAQDKLKQKMKEVQSMMLSDEEISKRVNNTKKYNIVELQQAYDQLKQKQMSLAAGEKTALLETRRQMKKLKTEIEAVKGESTGLMKIWKTAVRNIATYVGVFAGFNMVKSKIQQVAKANIELSDSFARVQKVTGLSRQEVDKLNQSFAKLDTRTSLSDLNELAYSAGKMGLGKYGLEQIEGFVRATNQLQVALGDDLGNSVDEAITPLAKLAENLGLIQKMGVEKSMMAIGSSINELSQTTTAVGSNIVDFARRVQPAAQMIGLSAEQILALGSASDAFGVSSEISATAFTKFLAAYRTNTAEIEKILSMVPGTLDKFFDEGRTMEGLLAIFQRMHDIGDLRYLEEAFKALGSEGSRMFTTFGAFAKNLDMFREHLATSTKAFEEATSVTREYELMQSTAAGILERANNIWEKAFVNPQGVDTVKELAVEWYKFSQELTQSETFMWGAVQALKSIAGVVELLITILPILVRSMFFYGAAAGIRKLVIEWNLMKVAMDGVATTGGKIAAFFKSNIWVLAATAIGYAVTYLIDYCSAQKKAVEANEESAKSMDRARQANEIYNQTLSSNYGNLMSKYDKLKREWRSLKTEHEKNKWIHDNKDAFNELGLSVNNAATAEEIFNKNTANVIEGFKRRAEAAALAAKMTQLYNQQMDIETESAEKLKTSGKNAGDKVTSNPSGVYTKDAEGDTYNQGQFRYDQTSGNYVYTAAGALEYNRRVLKGLQGDYDKVNQQIDETAARMEELSKKPIVGQTPVKTEGSGSGSGSTKELNAEYRDEQQKAKDIINKVKNFYQRQINAIKDMAAVGTIDEQRQKDMVDGMQQRMNEALSKVRKAIGGVENDWEDFRETMISDLYEPLNEKGENWSTDLVKDIVDNDLVQLRKMIQKLSDTLKKNGSVLLDEILRKATEDEGKNVDLANKRMRERQQELRRKNYTEQVDYDYIQHMDQFGIGTPTAEQDLYIQTMSQQGNKAEIEKFFNDRNDLWREGFLKARENLWQVIDTEIKTAEDGKSLLQIMYGDNYETVLKGSGLESLLSMQLDQWQVFYQKLIEMSDAWDDAQEKSYQEQKKRNDKRFENLPDVIGLNQMDTDYGKQQAENARWGKKQSIWERAGLGSMSKVTDDPEIKQYEIRQAKAQMYYEWMQRLRDQNYVSEEMLMDAKQKWADAQMALQDKVAEHARQKMEQIQQLLDPIKEFGAAAGDAMYLTVNGLEGEGEAWRNAVKNIIKTYGEMTIKLIEEQLLKMLVLKQHHQEEEDEEQAHQDRMKQIRNQGDSNEISAQNLLNAKIISVKKKGNKAEEKEDKKSEDEKVNIAGESGTQLLDIATQVGTGMVTAKKQEADQTQQIEQQQQATSLSGLISDTVAKVVLGIAGGSAKTISELGWWGLPLVAVISAALMGLLNYALSAIGGSSKSNNNAASAKKVKLASGMLTYDEGNVQTVVGDDGRVYRAREQRSLPEGVSMVTEPIATRVNGQAALVGERGPEIVIGRRTTRAIQMNRPDLLRDLAMIDRGITTRKVRTFDEGNISDMASAFAGQLPAPQQGQQGSEDSGQLSAEDARALTAAIGVFAQTVAAMQKNGIPAKIQKYGTGGLIDEVQSGLKFVSKYK